MSRDKKSVYYDAGGFQVIDIIKAKLTPEQYTGYLLGNTIKYACRLNFKGCAERDAEKLANYSKWLSEQWKVNFSMSDFQNNLRIDECGDCGNAQCSCSECDRDYIENIEGSKHHG